MTELTKLAFIDTETTGLDPDRHEIWEVALILRDPLLDFDVEYHWMLSPAYLGQADPMALKINRFYDRFVQPDNSRGDFASLFASLTAEAHLVGNVVSFDEQRLQKLLRANSQCPTWHYHLVDVEALVAGKLGIQPPWDSKELSLAVGVDPEAYEKHTAMGDTRWARDMYDAVFKPA